jgi:hypothetical protein
MKTILKQLFFLFIIYAELTAQTGGVKGRITGDKLPLPAANVLILETIYGTVTDERGFYEITDITKSASAMLVIKLLLKK